VTAPSGGESVSFGSVLTIEWRIDIPHNQDNWDLWYSTESREGEWIEIAMDLDPGSLSFMSIHTYEWAVPDVLADNVWVRVRMDNPDFDYYDVSNGSFSIVPAPGSLTAFGLVSMIAVCRRR